MIKYRVFVSAYPDEQTMRDHKKGDNALDLKRTSDIFSSEADSLDAAFEKFKKSEEFERFFAENSEAYFYYLDEKHNIHKA